MAEMKYIIWGCGKTGIWIKDCLSKNGDDVIAFSDSDFSKIGGVVSECKVISPYMLMEKFHDCNLVIPGIFGENAIKGIVGRLGRIPVEQVFIVPINESSKRIDNKKSIKLIRYLDWAQIDNLGIKLAQHCNLNCIRCNNFSNIMDEGFYELNEINRDLKKLRQLMPNILNIKLIGGEPLLNPDLGEIIYSVKEIYPESSVFIVSNGLLVDRISEDVFEAIRNCNVTILITIYPVLYKKVDTIVEILRCNEVKFSMYRNGEYFIPILNRQGKYNSDYPKKQINKVKCVSFFKGNISRCTVALDVEKYNEQFGECFPKGEYRNIYDKNLTSTELMRFLDDTMELCKYCNGCYDELNELVYGKQWRIGRASADDWICNI